MLEKLLDEFIDERLKIAKAETSSKQAHDLLMQAQEGSLVEVFALESLNLIPGSAKDASDAILHYPTGSRAQSRMGYEFQSHGVVGMLENLLHDSIGERTKMGK